MPIILDGVTLDNGGTVTFDGNPVKEIVFGTTTVWKAEQSMLDASVSRSSDYTLSSTIWDLSSYTSLTATFYIHGGYGRWAGDGSASSANGEAYIQLSDNTRITIPGTSYTLGGGASNTTSKTVTTTIDLSSYTSSQRANVRFGIHTVRTWAVATGMYVIGDGSATDVIAT